MPDRPAPRVRVVVLNWNSAWFTRRCLRALEATEYPADRLEIVLVDNASVDGSLEQLRHSFPSMRVIANADNLGFAEGCNRAMRDLDRVGFVALVNNDAVPEPGWLQPLVDALEDDPGAGAAAVRLVLEPAFTSLDLEVSGGSAVIESIRIGVVEVLDRALMEGVRSVGRIEWPMDLDHHVDDRARLLLPAGPGPRQLTVTVRGTGQFVARTELAQAELTLDGTSQQLDVAAGEERLERLNGLGTDLSADSEGFDRLYGEPTQVLDGVPVSDVPGFCGGGVLLRSAMLRQIGLFDPRFFAYYEDTDLSWRARRAGWRTLGVPGSIVRHAFGGSAGSKAAGFFFLNYRNWMMTVLRNATPSERRVAARSAWNRIKWAVRANILSALKHRRRPDLRLVAGWGRVVLAGLLALPRVRLAARRGRAGQRATDRVRSRLQPAPAPRPPGPRPGGPLVVYVDVTRTLELLRGADPGTTDTDCDADTLAERVGTLVVELGDAEPRIEAVAVVATTDPDSRGFRRATPTEWRLLTGRTDGSLPVDPSRLGLAQLAPGSVLLSGTGDHPATVTATAAGGVCGPVPSRDVATEVVIDDFGPDFRKLALSVAGQLLSVFDLP